MKTYAEHHGNGAKNIYSSFIFVWNWNQNEDNSKSFLNNVWNRNQNQDNSNSLLRIETEGFS
jgi:hypothetical protein